MILCGSMFNEHLRRLQKSKSDNMSIPITFLKKLMKDKAFMSAVVDVIREELQSNIEVIDQKRMCMWARGRTKIFGEQIEFMIQGRFRIINVKWICKARHSESETKVTCEEFGWTPKPAAALAMQTLVEKMMKTKEITKKRPFKDRL